MPTTSVNLVAFPALPDLGKFTLESDPPKTDIQRVVEYVKALPTGAHKRGIREGLKGISNPKKDAALEKAVERGLLELDSKGIYSVPGGRAHQNQPLLCPEPGTGGHNRKSEAYFD